MDDHIVTSFTAERQLSGSWALWRTAPIVRRLANLTLDTSSSSTRAEPTRSQMPISAIRRLQSTPPRKRRAVSRKQPTGFAKTPTLEGRMLSHRIPPSSKTTVNGFCAEETYHPRQAGI